MAGFYSINGPIIVVDDDKKKATLAGNPGMFQVRIFLDKDKNVIPIPADKADAFLAGNPGVAFRELQAPDSKRGKQIPGKPAEKVYTPKTGTESLRSYQEALFKKGME